MNEFAEESKYDISNISGAEIASNYEEARTDAWHTIESLNITKRIISVCKLLDPFRRVMPSDSYDSENGSGES